MADSALCCNPPAFDCHLTLWFAAVVPQKRTSVAATNNNKNRNDIAPPYDSFKHERSIQLNSINWTEWKCCVERNMNKTRNVAGTTARVSLRADPAGDRDKTALALATQNNSGKNLFCVFLVVILLCIIFGSGRTERNLEGAWWIDHNFNCDLPVKQS